MHLNLTRMLLALMFYINDVGGDFPIKLNYHSQSMIEKGVTIDHNNPYDLHQIIPTIPHHTI
jgi:hypothetical protein